MKEFAMPDLDLINRRNRECGTGAGGFRRPAGESREAVVLLSWP
jgi:hypothetical protein